MGIKYNWNFPSNNIENIDNIIKGYNIPKYTSKILDSRGIISHKDIKEYLLGDYEEGYDPYIMYDMEKAVERINIAIENEEKILVYGDYDADGITSTVLMLETLISMGANVSSYIPNRFTEGYGPNKEAFQNIIDNGITLIITVDNGIAAVEEIDFANELGCDVIITDHHKVQDVIPNAYAIIHPEHPKGEYPFKNLAGVGVAFKLAHALLDIYPDFLLDLVAIGTVADLVPLKSENRIFVKQGLELLNESPRLGLKMLLNLTNHKGYIDEQTIGFLIAPRLNAIGRIASAKEGLLFLSTESPEEADFLAKKVDDYNTERKKVTEDIIKDINEEEIYNNSKPIIMIYNENYHEGVLGIVASNLVEKFRKPVLIMNQKENVLKGSARSYGNFNIYEAINNISDLFMAFGGHSMAAGFSFDINNFELIEEKLCSMYEEYLLNNQNYKDSKNIDLVVNKNDISYQLLNELDLLKPYGIGFEKPLILIEDAFVLEKVEFGNQKQYLKLSIGQTDDSLECISFKENDYFKDINIGDTIDLLCNLDKNNFNGRTKLQVHIVDIEKKEYLFYDLRNSNVNFNNINKNELKLSIKYSDPNNNYYKFDEIDNIKDSFDVINILEIPHSIKHIEKILSMYPKKINLLFSKSKKMNQKYKINKNELIKFFNLILKTKSILLNKENTNKIMSILKINIDTLKIMIKIFLELDLISVENNKLVLNVNYKNIDLEKSKTYKLITNILELENLLIDSDIKEINKNFYK